jgi:hypothetical protein
MRLSARTLLGLGATVLVAIAVTWRLAATGNAGTVTTRTTAAPTASTHSANRSETPGATYAADARPPLPPQGTPLPALWDALAPAARAGDGPSACRLALTTLNCASQDAVRRFGARLRTAPPQGELQALQAFVSDPMGVVSEMNRALAPETVNRFDRMDAETTRFCGTIPDERRREAFALLRQAALAGVPDAQTAYVLWGAGITPHMEGTMADPTFERWMEETPIVLTRMLDAGHPEAPGLLAEAYGRDHIHGWLYPYDPMRAVAYAQLARRIGQTSPLGARFLDLRRSTLSSSQRAEADHMTERLFAAHYADRPLPSSQGQRALLGVLYLGIGPVPEGKAHECAAHRSGGAP